MHRCFAPPPDWLPDRVRLSPEEAHHLLRVLRVRPGERVTVFDGAGREGSGRVLGAAGGAELRDLAEMRRVPPPACRLVLVQALVRAAAMDWLVEKAVELGVDELVPVPTQRAVVRLSARQWTARAGRWRRIVLSAAKQCGRLWLPGLTPAAGLDEALTRAEENGLLLIGVPGVERALGHALESVGQPPGRVVVMIGPEGDFTAAERDLARRHGAAEVCFGPRVLRTETAALFALGVLDHVLRGRGGGANSGTDAGQTIDRGASAGQCAARGV